MSDDVTEDTELHEFRLQARHWLAANMARVDSAGGANPMDAPNRERVARARDLQAQLFEGGYAGITYPKEYGGQGRSLDYERVFLAEAAAYEMPTQVFAVSLNILGPTLVAFGSPEQKARHVPKMLSGEEIWLQLLSEPSGGSD